MRELKNACNDSVIIADVSAFPIYCENLIVQNQLLAALHKRREIRCFYITGTFTSPPFLYNTCIFRFGDKLPNLFFGQYICEYFLEDSPVDTTIFTETTIKSFQSFTAVSTGVYENKVVSLHSLSNR